MQDLSVNREEVARPINHLRLMAIALGVLAIAIAALLTPIPFHGRAVVAIGDLVHAPLFGGLTVGVLAVCQRLQPLHGPSIPLALRCLCVGMGIFTFGVLIEMIQSYFGRMGNIGDAINNGLGISAAALCYWGWQLKRSRLSSRHLPRAFFASAGMLLAIAWWIPLTLLLDVRAVHSAFPSLASFESVVQLSRFHFRECEARICRQDVTEGKHSMEVSYRETPHPAATLIELESNWSNMKTLEVDVTLDASYPVADVQFMIKVIDELHRDRHSDTYRGQWTLERGKTQRISVTREEILQGPDDRQTDLTKIRVVDLMLLAPVTESKVRFDDLRLTLESI